MFSVPFHLASKEKDPSSELQCKYIFKIGKYNLIKQAFRVTIQYQVREFPTAY